MVPELEVSGRSGESSAWGAAGTGGTGRRSQQFNARPPVNYTERDSSIDTLLMVEQGPATF